jgi:pimeloyl-ACP methyl ester carboxylesterase
MPKRAAVAAVVALEGLAYDAAYLKAFIATIKGPIVLVGHSYGGMVITNAATGNTNVKALASRVSDCDNHSSMITRLWRGWTASPNADAYERFLLSELFPSMHEIPGFRGADVLRKAEQGEVAFVTLTRFDSLEAIRAVAGDDYEMPVLRNRLRESCSRALTSARGSTTPHRLPLEQSARPRVGRRAERREVRRREAALVARIAPPCRQRQPSASTPHTAKPEVI